VDGTNGSWDRSKREGDRWEVCGHALRHGSTGLDSVVRAEGTTLSSRPTRGLNHILVVHPVNPYQTHVLFEQIQRPVFMRRDMYQGCSRVVGKQNLTLRRGTQWDADRRPADPLGTASKIVDLLDSLCCCQQIIDRFAVECSCIWEFVRGKRLKNTC